MHEQRCQTYLSRSHTIHCPNAVQWAPTCLDFWASLLAMRRQVLKKYITLLTSQSLNEKAKWLFSTDYMRGQGRSKGRLCQSSPNQCIIPIHEVCRSQETGRKVEVEVRNPIEAHHSDSGLRFQNWLHELKLWHVRSNAISHKLISMTQFMTDSMWWVEPIVESENEHQSKLRKGKKIWKTVTCRIIKREGM